MVYDVTQSYGTDELSSNAKVLIRIAKEKQHVKQS